MSLYNLKTTSLGWQITKFDSDLNVQSSYAVTATTCECPQGIKPTCRHRKMLPLIRDRANSAWFFNFEQGQWVDPTGQAVHDMEEAYGTSQDAREARFNKALANPPEGVTIVDLGNPEALHNTIAEAVGEPAPAPIRRRV